VLVFVYALKREGTQEQKESRREWFSIKGEMGYLAEERVDLATKGGDGPVSVAVMGSLGIPMVGVLFLHQGYDLGLERLHDLGSARRGTGNVSAQEVRRTVDFDKHCVCGYEYEYWEVMEGSVGGGGGGVKR
jgi:hypothetical protein